MYGLEFHVSNHRNKMLRDDGKKWCDLFVMLFDLLNRCILTHTQHIHNTIIWEIEQRWDVQHHWRQIAAFLLLHSDIMIYNEANTNKYNKTKECRNVFCRKIVFVWIALRICSLSINHHHRISRAMKGLNYLDHISSSEKLWKNFILFTIFCLFSSFLLFGSILHVGASHNIMS